MVQTSLLQNPTNRIPLHLVNDSPGELRSGKMLISLNVHDSRQESVLLNSVTYDPEQLHTQVLSCGEQGEIKMLSVSQTIPIQDILYNA